MKEDTASNTFSIFVLKLKNIVIVVEESSYFVLMTNFTDL